MNCNPANSTCTSDLSSAKFLGPQQPIKPPPRRGSDSAGTIARLSSPDWSSGSPSTIEARVVQIPDWLFIEYTSMDIHAEALHTHLRWSSHIGGSALSVVRFRALQEYHILSCLQICLRELFRVTDFAGLFLATSIWT